jgi:DNA end-binding protein Ku
MARIEEKVRKGETREITEAGKEDEGAPRSAQVIDLADLLKRSLGKHGGTSTERKVAASRAKPTLKVVASRRPAAKHIAKRKRA